MPGPFNASGGNGTGCNVPSPFIWNEYALKKGEIGKERKHFNFIITFGHAIEFRRPLDEQFYSRFASSYDWSSQWNAIGAHMAMGIEGHGWSAIRWIWWWPLVWILWPLVWRVGIASWDRWNDGLCTAGTRCIWCGRTTFAAWGTRFVQLKNDFNTWISIFYYSLFQNTFREKYSKVVQQIEFYIRAWVKFTHCFSCEQNRCPRKQRVSSKINPID